MPPQNSLASSVARFGTPWDGLGCRCVSVRWCCGSWILHGFCFVNGLGDDWETRLRCRRGNCPRIRSNPSHDLLRLLTCGSVDDGKSTLIGRLLYDAHLIHEDQLATLEADSKSVGTTGGGFDPALLTDGLKAEREQGITIDVAFRYFATSRRSFIVADTPGHEQYTRNMVTGASTCDLAIILVDAQHGVRTQTRRHATIAALLGIRHLILAVNKMDLVEWRQDVFEAISEEFRDFASRLTVPDIQSVPLAALPGDNLVHRSAHMPWYDGSTVLHLLETVRVVTGRNVIDLRFPIQRATRPSSGFRGYQGTVRSGILRTGDDVVVLPDRTATTVKEIVTFDGPVQEAPTGTPVTVTLDDDVAAGRGDMIVHAGNQPNVTQHVEAMVVWMSPAPLVTRGRYLMKHLSRSLTATLTQVAYRLDVEQLRRVESDRLQVNDIGRCAFDLDRPLAWDTYERNRATGAFILIDRLTSDTVAAGMIIDRVPESARRHEALVGAGERKSAHVVRQPDAVGQDERQARLAQQPVTVWLTGLSGSGKSSIAAAVERRLFEAGHLCVTLDGDNLRFGLNRDLAFSKDDRRENIRRISEVARLFNNAGMIVLVPAISPFQEDRARARGVIGADRFVEVWVDAPIEVCEARDAKGLYRKARAGEIPEFTGISSPYEPPTDPDLRVATSEQSAESAAAAVFDLIESRVRYR